MSAAPSTWVNKNSKALRVGFMPFPAIFHSPWWPTPPLTSDMHFSWNSSSGPPDSPVVEASPSEKASHLPPYLSCSPAPLPPSHQAKASFLLVHTEHQGGPRCSGKLHASTAWPFAAARLAEHFSTRFEIPHNHTNTQEETSHTLSADWSPSPHTSEWNTTISNGVWVQATLLN